MLSVRILRTTVFAFLLLVVHTRLTLGRMLSRNWRIHLVLELLIPLLHLDGLLQPEDLIGEDHLAALHGRVVDDHSVIKLR